jgi:hypothetical protein
MELALGEIWDFHTDVRLLVSGERGPYERQLDLDTCWAATFPASPRRR